MTEQKPASECETHDPSTEPVWAAMIRRNWWRSQADLGRPKNETIVREKLRARLNEKRYKARIEIEVRLIAESGAKRKREKIEFRAGRRLAPKEPQCIVALRIVGDDGQVFETVSKSSWAVLFDGLAWIDARKSGTSAAHVAARQSAITPLHTE